MKKVTLNHYWEALDVKQRRLIWDLLRMTTKRASLPMGLLPFVPVDEVLRQLRNSPMSPWTHMLYEELCENNRGEYWLNGTDGDRHRKSHYQDIEDYGVIIKILTRKEDTPSHLAQQLQRWKEQNSKEESHE